MHAGGLAADEQLLGDLAVGAPFDQQMQHLNLAGGEAGQGPLGRHAGANVEAASASQRLHRSPKRLGAKSHRRLVGCPGGVYRLLPLSSTKQRLSQAPLAASHRVHMTSGKGFDRGLPAQRVGMTLKPGPLGCCLGMPTAEVHVVR
jgi:hypothetical protein